MLKPNPLDTQRKKKKKRNAYFNAVKQNKDMYDILATTIVVVASMLTIIATAVTFFKTATH